MGNELEMEEQLDWLDAKLREEMPYIDDAGFTAHVARKLPAQRRFASRKLRAAILLLAALMASVVGFVVAGPSLEDAAAYLFALPWVTLVVLAVTVALVAMLAGGSFALSRIRSSR